mmetsp:Transcript_31023/g.65440  ORF Transcript_31023/g.65440 Transcript_31023/m.65440 type:complete len:227 (+) Transcript_31023:1927-2607(+)
MSRTAPLSRHPSHRPTRLSANSTSTNPSTSWATAPSTRAPVANPSCAAITPSRPSPTIPPSPPSTPNSSSDPAPNPPPSSPPTPRTGASPTRPPPLSTCSSPSTKRTATRPKPLTENASSSDPFALEETSSTTTQKSASDPWWSEVTPPLRIDAMGVLAPTWPPPISSPMSSRPMPRERWPCESFAESAALRIRPARSAASPIVSKPEDWPWGAPFIYASCPPTRT